MGARTTEVLLRMRGVGHRARADEATGRVPRSPELERSDVLLKSDEALVAFLCFLLEAGHQQHKHPGGYSKSECQINSG